MKPLKPINSDEHQFGFLARMTFKNRAAIEAMEEKLNELIESLNQLPDELNVRVLTALDEIEKAIGDRIAEADPLVSEETDFLIKEINSLNAHRHCLEHRINQIQESHERHLDSIKAANQNSFLEFEKRIGSIEASLDSGLPLD